MSTISSSYGVCQQGDSPRREYNINMPGINNINININLAEIQKIVGDIGLRLGHLNGNDVAFLLLAILLPPIAVLIKVGLTTQFWINVVLTILGVVPGQIHALWIVLF